MAVFPQEIPPAPLETPQQVLFRNVMSALLDSRGDTLQGKLRRIELQEDDLDPVPGLFPAPETLRIRRPLKVLSNTKLSPALASRSSSAKTIRPAAAAANDGFSGDRPPAIKSAFTKRTIPASFGRNSRANVVFPAPFGPAMTRQTGRGLRTGMVRKILLPPKGARHTVEESHHPEASFPSGFRNRCPPSAPSFRLPRPATAPAPRAAPPPRGARSRPESGPRKSSA